MSNQKKRVRKMDENSSMHTVTGRFNGPLFYKMQEWLDKNGMSANQLLAKAVERYISEPQVLKPVELVFAKDGDVDKVVDKLMVEHKRALDELK